MATMPAPVPSAADLAAQAELALRASPVPSPCRNICHMDPFSGYCAGCLRTIDEIAGWSSASDEDKRHVWAQLPQRAAWLAGEEASP
ncbi:DUF1289 domain-containing protein [Cupriavidus taiwanensis]|uniref:Fe-S protein n=1 Tax=Cupriavidus taiwanensis TaxID=164546 RepID=A0A375IKA4_9BURK|nr:DUF1289 domain-containing protein [Cupriavidus taiwanensis]SOY51283.1 conserved hypothetical protein; putative exported protein [Cupriavidus taiwanensis]SOY54003.1 conserved hypothetical protein; putative exported protein [Cupriavidus taiwanensis]SOY84060.1 conserved hypothetical protein; putative exported protein [Cupriavidus taiwanensis]SOZ24006.1 conserved hypothetical protein; putative exported protein [Cupriavidus taiwanensis]SOZ58648.1 conserved hypothetical protein; putative exported